MSDILQHVLYLFRQRGNIRNFSSSLTMSFEYSEFQFQWDSIRNMSYLIFIWRFVQSFLCVSWVANYEESNEKIFQTLTGIHSTGFSNKINSFLNFWKGICNLNEYLIPCHIQEIKKLYVAISFMVKKLNKKLVWQSFEEKEKLQS